MRAGAAAYAGQPSHVYDQGNRLVEVRDPVTQAVLGQYTYDAAGRRVRKVAGGVTTLYFYDAAGHLVESQNLSTSPATRRSYVFVEDEPMGVVDLELPRSGRHLGARLLEAVFTFRATPRSREPQR